MADPWQERLITVAEPWASAIVDGHKPTENRSPGFNMRYRGRLWIHTSKRWSDRGAASPLIRAAYPDMLQPVDRGYVIGHVDVVDIHRSEGDDCPWGEDSYEDSTGHLVRPVIHMVLENPVRIPEPIPATGALGMWRPRAGVHDDLVAELAPHIQERP